MPELNNIQTFEAIEDRDLDSSLNRFQKVLNLLGLLSEEVRASFESIEWKRESNGFVYLDKSLPWLNYQNIRIRPSLTVYTRGIDESFRHNWVAYELLLLTEEIITLESRYNIDNATLKAICKGMITEFVDMGVYFTNEMQDGEDFDGVRVQDTRRLWNFEYALIPQRLNNLYGASSGNFKLLSMEGEWQEYIKVGAFEKHR